MARDALYFIALLIQKVGPHVKAYLPSSGFFSLGTP